MRFLTRRTLPWILLAGLLGVGLTGAATASIPLAIDRNDGFTFSGVGTTIRQPQTGPPIIDVAPIGPTLVSGHQANVILGYSREVQNTFDGCISPIIKTIIQNINRAVVHHRTTIAGTPQLETLDVVIPDLDNTSGTTPLPLGALGFNATVTNSDRTVRSVPLAPTSPPAGADAAFSASVSPMALSGEVKVDVNVQGPPTPPIPVMTNPVSPPEPFDEGCADTSKVSTVTARGVEKIVFSNMYVVLGFATTVPPATLTIVKEATPNDPQDFAFSSPQLGTFVLDDDGDDTTTNPGLGCSRSRGASRSRPARIR
jgi:hypothetical protein